MHQAGCQGVVVNSQSAHGSGFHQHVEAERLQACHRVGDERDATLPHKGFLQHANCQCAHGRFLDVVVISPSVPFAGAALVRSR